MVLLMQASVSPGHAVVGLVNRQTDGGQTVTGGLRMPKPSPLSRRQAVKLGATAATLPLVHIRTAGAAGKLNMGFWDHWVPGANAVMQKQVDVWAEKNKVEVNADFITTSGGKLQMTPAAETQAKAGHDVMSFITWDVQNYAESLG